MLKKVLLMGTGTTALVVVLFMFMIASVPNPDAEHVRIDENGIAHVTSPLLLEGKVTVDDVDYQGQSIPHQESSAEVWMTLDYRIKTDNMAGEGMAQPVYRWKVVGKDVSRLRGFVVEDTGGHIIARKAINIQS